MHILVVDDDHDLRHVFSLAFARLGHQVKTAANGIEALTMVEQHQQLEHQCFDAVLLDVEMPTLSGWNVLEAIRKMPCGEDLPVILFTAHGNITSDSYARMLGAHALLRKPISPQEILDVIQRVLAERKD